MCNLYSYLLIFLCILLVYPDWFCLFFNTQPDFWVLFDMSVIYFIYIANQNLYMIYIRKLPLFTSLYTNYIIFML